ncbi:MAG: 3-phosphoshikimate 1-carboxyvinyltransferase [Candidatus Omnitrophica bacterium]|nr:3-phosphoshikimate 1-carboxyvinyltransferase [Candidatus Omnitrophota bacterium]
MSSKVIKPIRKLFGELTLPGDKSISHRAVMIGAIAEGDTSLKGLLDCDDCDYTIRAFRDMGIVIEKKGGLTIVKGRGLRGLKKPGGVLDAGNSGTTMRLLAGILAGHDFEATLTGGESLSNRPMRRIVEPLSLMGADIMARDSGYPPLTIKGGSLKPIDYHMPISSAQVKSAILLAGLYAKGITKVEEPFKSRDHTERMLKHFGAKLKAEGPKVSVEGPGTLKGRSLEVPGDISSASFFLVGATLLKGSKIRINKIGINPTRAGILRLLSKMGSKVKILNESDLFEPVADIEVAHAETHGVVIEEEMIPGLIDELPIIFVLASLSKGVTVIRGAKELRLKETDRIHSLEDNLKKMGSQINIKGDELIIEGRKVLQGASLKSFGDHRTCMAVTVAALCAKGESSIDDVECVNKSFPGFFTTLEGLQQ